MKKMFLLLAVSLILLTSCLTVQKELIKEAEDMTLGGNYIVERSVWIKGKKTIWISPFYPDSKPGTASFAFQGKSDYYEIKVYFFDENDGKCTFNLYINDQKIDTWMPDKDFGDKHASFYNYQIRLVSGVKLESGDTVKLEGIAHVKDEKTAELARVDKISLVQTKDKIIKALTIDAPEKK